MKEISTEHISPNYLHINSCGCDVIQGIDTNSLRPEGRSDYHILYIAEGVCFVNLDDKIVQAPAGSVVVFLPYQKQHYQFHKNISSKSYYIHFSGSGCGDLMKKFNMADKNIFYIGYSNQLKGLFDSLIDEFRLKFEYYDESCQGMLLNILSLIGRKIKESESSLQHNVKKQITEICREIYANYHCDFSIKDFALQCYLSESRFSHIFKEMTGISIKQYILKAKIEMSIELLENSDYSILQISNKVGFLSQNYFSRIFKKHTRVSPTQYREKSRKNI